MRSRTMRIAAAGLLVAAVVSARPALGQCPDEKCSEPARTANPWRSAKVNPWRGHDVPVVTVPCPQTYEITLEVPSLTWTYHGPTLLTAPAPRPASAGWFFCCGLGDNPPAQLTIDDLVRMSGRDPVTLASGCATPGQPACWTPTRMEEKFAAQPAQRIEVLPPTVWAAQAANTNSRLHGTWYREVPGAVVAFTFTGDELKAVANVNIDGVSGCVTLTAEYAVSRDGTVHGFITGADANGSGDLGGLELVSVAVVAQMFVDQPFAFRVKPTADGLMLSSIRFPAAEPVFTEQGPGPKMSALLCGLYRSTKGGTIPTAKALKMSGNAGEPCCEGLLDMLGGMFGKQKLINEPQQWLGGMTLPSPKYLEHYPQYFPPDPAFPLPRELASQEDPEGLARRAGIPGAGPMPLPCPVPMPVGGPCCPPPVYPGLAPGVPAGVVPCPHPGYAAVPVSAPPMVAFPPPPPYLARPEPLPARTGYVGEWQRTVGPCTIGLSVTANQMTARGVLPVNGEPLRVVVTADCRELRDGLLAGVITCAEVEPVGGSDRFDSDPGRLRELVDQPFSCRYQVRGDELIVIDLKVGGEHQIDAADLGIIGGRYAKGAPKWPTVGKGQKSAVTPTSGAAIGAMAGGLIGAGVGTATGRTADETLPKDAIRVGIDFNAPLPVNPFRPGQSFPGAVRPMLPPEQLPLPEPPVPDKPKGKGKKKRVLNTYSADPNARMEQLLGQSEDLRQLGQEWRRLWFNDQPSHLTPERVHGAIR